MVLVIPSNPLRITTHRIANQKLRTVIDGHNLPLGATQSGKDWCIKALHPSDPLTEVRGIPDQSSVPSIFLNYQTVAEITNPNPAAVGTWSADLALLPHPVGFLYHKETDSVGVAQGCVLNSQLTGVSHTLKFQNMLSFAERWRLAYMSVTVYQDGADLTNQGTLVACQSVVKGHAYHPHIEAILPNAEVLLPRTYFFLASDMPDYDKSQSMPNAYFNRSKEGCYMPLKLTETHQRWHSSGKAAMITSGSLESGASQNLVLPIATATTAYPFPGLTQAWVNPSAGTHGGEATSDFCNDVWGFINAKNLALTTKLQVFIRAGYEIQVQPGTVFSPHQKLSPPQDNLALATYFTISRELKDAYPADYNDLGKIWDAISGVAKSVGTFLVGTGHPVASAIGLGVNGVANAGDVIRRAVSGSEAGRNQGSLADKELAQNVVDYTTLPPGYLAGRVNASNEARRFMAQERAAAAANAKVIQAKNVMRRGVRQWRAKRQKQNMVVVPGNFSVQRRK